jgi:copper chaperone CopZ
VPQMTLFAPDITCDHCIATIKETTERIQGARFVAGDPQARAFVVEVGHGAVLDDLEEALAAEGYPLGDASIGAPKPAAPRGEALPMAGAPAAGFRPRYRVERSEAGAEVHYNCPCGSQDEVFRYDRSRAEQSPHSCCGHHLLVAPDAEGALRARLGEGYAIDVQTVEMPWGQPLQAAFAVRA